MSVTPGSKLGPYDVVSAIGAGGMGEVYRARDTRLGRDVAIKVLPAAFASDADRLRRFEQEARATAALNHPNILAVFDIGNAEGAPYVVSELLEGETLRERLRTGALPARKCSEIAIQIAQGLAAAHEKGILHRDLKPENLFLTHDGRLKILDFGLAKLTQSDSATAHSMALTAEAVTDPGTTLGTMGYMSPEQVRGVAVDARSDLFSFGAILYEMLSGRRAFHGSTPADTMSAILKEDPPDLIETNRSISPALERIVRHCLEKNPAQRFHSARDIAFDLEALSATSATAPMRAQAVAAPRWRPVAGVLLGLALLAAAFFIGRKSLSTAITVPEVHQLTFRRGAVKGAAFAPDGRTVVYSAAWEGSPQELFTTSEQSPESRSLDIKDAQLLSISTSGELALKLHPHILGPFARPGTLAVVPLTGGSPRALLNDVEGADWSPDGSQMAVVQVSNGQYALQYPIGKMLFSSPFWVSHPKVSPSGEVVAFLNHPFGGDEGSVMVADKSGKVRELSKGWYTVQGLAWAPDGKEIWFTGTRNGANRALYVMTLDGKEHVAARVPGELTIWSISAQGRVLMSEAYDRLTMIAMTPGAAEERDLSWFDYGVPTALSDDGKMLLFFEAGEGGGAGYTTYLRPTDGSPAIRLGEGRACDLTYDGSLALSQYVEEPRVFLVPTTGAPQELTLPGLRFASECGGFVPGTRKIVFAAGETGHRDRLYLFDPDGHTPPHAISPEGVSSRELGSFVFAPDGTSVIARNELGEAKLYPLAGGEPQFLKGLNPDERVNGILSDGHTLLVSRPGEVPEKVFRLNINTGERQLWKQIGPADRAGVDGVGPLRTYHDGNAYIYSYVRDLSELYLYKGLR